MFKYYYYTDNMTRQYDVPDTLFLAVVAFFLITMVLVFMNTKE